MAIQKIGVITENVSAADGAPNGASSCCRVGEKVYQSSANTHEILVYTKLFPRAASIGMSDSIKGNSGLLSPEQYDLHPLTFYRLRVLLDDCPITAWCSWKNADFVEKT